jgi:hypothetical protein
MLINITETLELSTSGLYWKILYPPSPGHRGQGQLPKSLSRENGTKKREKMLGKKIT